MADSKTIIDVFFDDLKEYNSTNFKAIATADVSIDSPAVNKAFSSVVTRYFIFLEKHPEYSDSDRHYLFYRLGIDLIAKYFSNYHIDNSASLNRDPLKTFQDELIQHSSYHRKVG